MKVHFGLSIAILLLLPNLPFLISSKTICSRPEDPSNSQWLLFRDNCYLFYDSQLLDWYDAKDFCEVKGASLTSVHSVEELSFLASEHPASVNFWIGLSGTDALNSSYTWTDGTPFQFANFVKDDAKYPTTCVSVNSSNGSWLKNSCSLQLPAVCKTKDIKSDLVVGYCHDGWFSFGDKCYRIFGRKFSERATWPDADKKCEEIGAQLVSIHSREEQDFLTYNVLRKYNMAWTGLHSKPRITKHFVWKDGSDVDFTFWARDQPDYGDTEEFCSDMQWKKLSPGEWHDYRCATIFSFICQAPKDPTLNEPGVDPNTCVEPAGWENLDFICYKVYSGTENRRTWFEANSFCQTFSGNLATIRNSAVQDLMNKNLTGQDELFWIGLRIMGDGSYTWSGTPTLVEYNNWEFDQIPAGASDLNNCVAVNSEGKWIIRNCLESHSLICESGTGPPEISFDTNLACPNISKKWKDLGGKYCYYTEFTERVSWYEAQSRCSQEGGSLAIFPSADELGVLLHYMNWKWYDVHIGLFRNPDTFPHFKWVDDTPLSYATWDPSELIDDYEANCVQMNIYHVVWRKRNCLLQAGFICSAKKGRSPVRSGSVTRFVLLRWPLSLSVFFFYWLCIYCFVIHVSLESMIYY